MRREHTAAQVHERLRLHELHLRRANEPTRHERLSLGFPPTEMPNVGEVIENPPADVVPRALVLFARIAEPEDDLHRRTRSSAARSESHVRDAPYTTDLLLRSLGLFLFLLRADHFRLGRWLLA